MSTFTSVVILGVLMILGGISLMATPLITFMSSGVFIIVLFFIWGLFGIIRGISEKRYDKEFFFAILSLILGIASLAVPGALAMTNSVLLYLAAAWFILHGVLTIIASVENKRNAGTAFVILGVIMGVLEVITGIFSIIHPGSLAVYLGLLIGFYYVETGLSTIIVGKAVCKGGNSMTIFLTVMGILTLISGFTMLATPVQNFMSTGYFIIMLFFIHGIVGLVRGFLEKRFDKSFFFAILSLILGIVGLCVPNAVAMTNSVLLYLAAAWFILHGVLGILNAIQSKEEAGTGFMILGIILGVLELILAIYSIAHPAVLVIQLGLLVAFYFIESGLHMIFVGSAYAKAVALGRRAL